MKRRKHVITIGVFALTAFIFITCNNDDRKPYYGTWGFTEYGTKLIFSADKFIFLDEKNDLGFTLSPVKWTAVINNNDETKDDFPTGYKVSGIISEHHGNVGWKTGSDYNEDWAYYIKNDKQHMIEQGDYRFWYQELTKITD